MNQPQLIPKPPRKMRQPTKDRVRQRAELAEARLAYASTPRWWRLWNRLRVRVVETEKDVAEAMKEMHGG